MHLLSTGPCEIFLFHITVVVITDDNNLFWGTYSESAAWLHLFPPPMCNLESRPFKSMWSRQTLSRPWEVFGRKKIISECPRSESPVHQSWHFNWLQHCKLSIIYSKKYLQLICKPTEKRHIHCIDFNSRSIFFYHSVQHNILDYKSINKSFF